jgi:DNA-directed RNA polymerase specialized sigma24 family protein
VETPVQAAAFAHIVRAVQVRGEAGIEALRVQFTAGLSLLLARSLGSRRAQEVAQEVLRAAARAIQGGELTEPAGLPSLVKAIARRTLERELAGRFPHSRLEPEKVRLAGAILESMPARSREILRRFYLEKQTPGRICADTGLSPEQFRRLASEARRQFAAGLRRKPAARPPLLNSRVCAVQGSGET